MDSTNNEWQSSALVLTELSHLAPGNHVFLVSMELDPEDYNEEEEEEVWGSEEVTHTLLSNHDLTDACVTTWRLSDDSSALLAAM